MKTTLTTVQKRFLALMAAGLVCYLILFYTATVLSLHVHITPDGRMVAHSHPVSSENRQSHRHTSREFLMLDHAVRSEGVISKYIVDGFVLIDRPAESTPPDNEPLPVTAILPCWSGRAPPADLLF